MAICMPNSIFHFNCVIDFPFNYEQITGYMYMWIIKCFLITYVITATVTVITTVTVTI